MKNFSFSKTMLIFLSAFLISAFSACTIRQVQPVSQTISVSGTGVVSVNSDQVTITMSVKTSAKELADASQENSVKMEAVNNALLESGIAKEDISTKNFNIYQASRWENGRQIKGNQQVSNQLLVIVRNPSNAGKVIDAAVKAGANEFSSLEYNVSNTAPAVKQARILAMKKAEEAAKLLAGTGGASVGKILSIEEDFVPFSDPVMLNAVASDSLSKAATKISAGKTDVSVTVHVTYSLQ